MRRQKHLFAVLSRQLTQLVDEMPLKRRMQMSVGLVKEEHIKLVVQGQRVDAEPLQEAAAFNHEVFFRSSWLFPELLICQLTFPRGYINGCVVQVVERVHAEPSLENFVQHLEELLPCIVLPNVGQLTLRDSSVQTSRLLSCFAVLVPEVVEQVPQDSASKTTPHPALTRGR